MATTAPLITDLNAFADTIADHLTEPTYCIDDAGEYFMRFNVQVSTAGDTVRIVAASDTNHPERFEIIVRRIDN